MKVYPSSLIALCKATVVRAVQVLSHVAGRSTRRVPTRAA
jgi:hypothetical protein